MSGQHPEDQNKANPFVTGNEYRQPPQQQKSTSTWVIVAIVGASSIFVMLFCGGIFMGLTLPAVQVAREAARRMSCSNNMKEIGIALHNYHSAYGSLPPAYTVDDQARPLHSWRTLILPFLEQQALYEQIDLSKPWDDPVNAAIAAIAVPTYMCPSAAEPSAFTSYVAVLDPDGMMMGDRPIRFQDVTDGLSNTVMIVEIEPRQGVSWMSPQDITLQEFADAGPGALSHHIGGSHVLMGDGAVRFITDNLSSQERNALGTRSDDDPVE